MAKQRWYSHRVQRGLTVGIIALVALMGGCGDDDDDDADTATSETTMATTTTATSTTEAPTTSEPTPTEPVKAPAEVYFATGDGSDCSTVEAFPRSISVDVDPIEATFDELVAGPTAEEAAAGATSFFSSATADVVSEVTQRDGLLIVDFTDLRSLIPNASTSCGSEALLAELNSTSFQFASVERVRYRIEGSCDELANWLQRDCFDADRSGRQLGVPTIERASGSGCTPESADGLPDGLWFGLVGDPQADQLSFDLACWFAGSAAATAAGEDGEESPPPNDYHIRNESDRLRTLTVDPAAEVSWLPNPGDAESLEVVGYAAWLAEQPGRADRPGVWLTVEAEQVVSIEEQYVP